METIGKYQITGELGSGGFGRVYKALDPTVGRIVAIKVLNVQDDPALVMRFEAEAKTSANLQHKNIVIVHEFGEEIAEGRNKKQFLVMEYLAGQNLQDIINQRAPIAPLDKLVIMAEVAHGLQYAHEHGVVHRDVKPANIMRLTDGGVKIMDFGIARLLRSANTRLTQAGIMIGTPQYMAPEQFTSETADERCDVWAYGVVFYEFLAGVNPFHGDNPPQMIYRVTAEDPPPISTYAPGLPSGLDAIVKRILAKPRDERYASFEDVLFDLEPVILELKRAQVEELLKTAGQSMEDGNLDAALLAVRQILDLDQTNAQARKWRKELPELIRQHSVQERVRSLIEQAQADAERRDYAAALVKVSQGLSIDKGNQRLRALREEFSVRQERVSRAAGLVNEARADFLANSLTLASEKARQAAQQDPQNPDATALVDQIGAAIERREVEARRKAALSKAKGLILVQDYDNAVSVLQELGDRHADDREVLERLEEARRLQAAYAAQLKIDAAILESRDLIRRGLYQRAIDELQALDQDIPQKNQVADLLTYALEQLESEKRTAEVEDLIRQASEAPMADFELTLSLVDRALNLAPGNERALRLRKSALAARQAELEDRAVRRSVQDCRVLLLAGRLDEAVATCGELKSRNPDHPAVIELGADIDKLVRERRERQEREMQTRILDVQRLMDQGDLSGATQVLNTLTVQYPNNRQIAPLVDDLALARQEQEKRQAIAGAVQRAGALARDRHWGQALWELDRGLTSFPGASELLREKSRIQELEKRQAIEAALAGARERAGQKRWDEALAELDRALAIWPDAPELQEEKARLKERVRRDAVQACLAKTAELANAKRWDEAQGEIEQALATWPDAPELQQAQVRLGQQKRGDAIQSAIAAIAGLEKARLWDQAQAELGQALATWPDAPELQREKVRLERAVAAEKERIRRDAIQGCLAKAGELAKAKRWEQAHAAIEHGVATWPDAPELQQEKVRLGRTLAAEKERTRREGIDAAIARAAESVAAGNWGQALSELDQGLNSWPESSELQKEKGRVAQLRIRAAIEEAIARVRALATAKQWDEAQSELERSLKSWPGAPELAQEKKLLAREAIQTALQRARDLEKSGQTEQALAEIDRSLAKWTDAPELAQEKSRLTRAVAAEKERARREGIQSTLTRAAELAGGKRWDLALGELGRGLERWPDSSELLQEQARITQKKATQQAAEDIQLRLARHELDAALAAADSAVAKFPGEALFLELREQGRRQLEFERLLKDAENLVFEDQLERAASLVSELRRRAPDDAKVLRLEQALERRQTRVANLAAAEQLCRRMDYQGAQDLVTRVLLDNPEDASAGALLKRIERDRAAQERQQRIDQARAGAAEQVRRRQFAAAMEILQKIAADFPDEEDLQDDLRRTRDQHVQFERNEASARGRAEWDALMHKRSFEEALERAKQLASAYPEEGFQQQVAAASDAIALRDRTARVEAEIAEINKLYAQGDAASVRSRASALLATCEDPRARELLKLAERQLAQLHDLKRKTGRRGIDWRIAAVAAVAIVAVVSWLIPRPGAGPLELQLSEAALTFSYKPGDTLVASKTLQLTGKPADEAWIVETTDPWLKASPATQLGNGTITVQVDPQKLSAGTHSGLVTVSSKNRTVSGKVNVTFTMAGEGAPPPAELRVSPGDLQFTWQRGGPVPSPRTLQVSGKGSGETWVVREGADWFTAAPRELTGDGSISVQVLPQKLGTAAEYSSVLTILGKRGAGTPVLVNVKLSVVSEGAPQLRVSPDTLTFTYKRGGANPAAQSAQLNIRPSGEAWSAAANLPWIKLTPNLGAGDAAISVQVDPQKLPAGDNSGSVSFSSKNSPGSAASLTIRLNIADAPAQPLEPAIDCHANDYFGLSSDTVLWNGLLQPGHTLTIDRHNVASQPGTVKGSHLPGCPVTITTSTKGIEIADPPSQANNFGHVTLRNSSPSVVPNPSFQWTVK